MTETEINMSDEQLIVALEQALRVVQDNEPMKLLLEFMLTRFKELIRLETELRARLEEG